MIYLFLKEMIRLVTIITTSIDLLILFGIGIIITRFAAYFYFRDGHRLLHLKADCPYQDLRINSKCY